MNYEKARDIQLGRCQSGDVVLITDTGNSLDNPTKISEEQLRYLFSVSGRLLSNTQNKAKDNP